MAAIICSHCKGESVYAVQTANPEFPADQLTAVRVLESLLVYGIQHLIDIHGFEIGTTVVQSAHANSQVNIDTIGLQRLQKANPLGIVSNSILFYARTPEGFENALIVASVHQ